MKVYRDLNDLPKFKKAVITIGSFDGVHCGHQKILEKVCQTAENIGGESVVITFHPHPRQIIYPKDNTLELINTTEEKIKRFKRSGLDNVVVVPFSIEFAQLSADEYIHKFLIEKFNPSTIVIGYDHRFGLNRQGDFNYLKYHAEAGGYDLVEIKKQTIKDISVSSTKIRNAIKSGDVSGAAELLGHKFTLTGTVVHGKKTGTKLGFPTANIFIKEKAKLIPPIGIYAVYVWHELRKYKGMLYIGNRPTVDKDGATTIEVNIFDFDEKIYDQQLEIELVDYIRDDAKFEDLDGLIAQLKKDKTDSLKCLEEEEMIAMKKKTLPQTSIVILNYNTKKHLEQFLPGVIKNSPPETRIVVADNGSEDNSASFVRANFPRVSCVELNKNHGFAQGYNLALQEEDADYYVLLNSDVETPDGWLEPILKYMEDHPKVAACQPKVRAFHDKELFEHAGANGGWMDIMGYPFCRGRILNAIEKDEGQYDDVQEVFWATGAALVVRAKLFHDIGGFDKDYFAHFEEIDLCWRLKRAGYGIAVIPQSVVYHMGGGTLNYTSPLKTYLNFRNSLYTLFKNESKRNLFWIVIFRLILDGVAGGLFLTQGKFKFIWMIIKAHLKFYVMFPALFKKRRYYKGLIEKVRIGEWNGNGLYKGSVIWNFYARGRKKFSDLF
jgi:riboflavin kinase/FMN adenylyltransferase